LLEKMDVGHKDFATEIMVSVLAETGKLPEAIIMVSSLNAPAEEPGNSLFAPLNYKAGAQGHIAKAQAKAGDIAGALKTIAMMPDREDKADALSAIVFAQRKAGDAIGAQRSYEQCLSIRADAEKNHWDVSNVAKWGMDSAQLAARAGKWEEARRIAENGLKDGSLFGRYALNGLVWAYEEAGDYAGALEAIKLAKEPGTFYYGIGRAQATDGDVIGALTWASSEASPKWKANALIGIARGVLDRAGKAKDTH
jgi:tetratricopeptide (TPR) repeat protein